MAKYENIRALAKKQLQAVTESSDRWKAFLRTAAMRLHLQRQNWRTSNSAMRKWVFHTVLKCIGAATAATRPFLYRPIQTMPI